MKEKFLAESKDISYRITLGNDLRLDFLEELDLISIVGNLLDNALEAAEKTEDGRYVECRMYMGKCGGISLSWNFAMGMSSLC